MTWTPCPQPDPSAASPAAGGAVRRCARERWWSSDPPLPEAGSASLPVRSAGVPARSPPRDSRAAVAARLVATPGAPGCPTRAAPRPRCGCGLGSSPIPTSMTWPPRSAPRRGWGLMPTPTSKTTQTERMTQPLTREVAEQLATDKGACIRPVARGSPKGQGGKGHRRQGVPIDGGILNTAVRDELIRQDPGQCADDPASGAHPGRPPAAPGQVRPPRGRGPLFVGQRGARLPPRARRTVTRAGRHHGGAGGAGTPEGAGRQHRRRPWRTRQSCR